jgi:hypothetical protein
MKLKIIFEKLQLDEIDNLSKFYLNENFLFFKTFLYSSDIGVFSSILKKMAFEVCNKTVLQV